MGLITRVVDRLKAGAAEEQRPAPPEDRAEGVTLIAEVGRRERATVQGRVRAVTPPAGLGRAGLSVEIVDASASARLVFLGRTHIPGIESGVTLRATGRLARRGQHRIIYNPSYEIVPPREH
ncbi:MAG: OB-fold nucleic acid binding domain-containing protein [Actinomycetia bacterium]|nr:OB-fold nucleic acid binding domain-containing protein [Actinomycetes bacterium]